MHNSLRRRCGGRTACWLYRLRSPDDFTGCEVRTTDTNPSESLVNTARIVAACPIPGSTGFRHEFAVFPSVARVRIFPPGKLFDGMTFT